MEKKKLWIIGCSALVVIAAIIIAVCCLLNKNKAVELKPYESADGWKLEYDEKDFTVSDLGNGEICFSYNGKSSGTNAVVISYHKDKMPDELLYEKIGDVEPGTVERGESRFGIGGYASHYREIVPENINPKERDAVYESLTAIEHNGGTILVDCYKHYEVDTNRISARDNALSQLLNTFDLVNHEPQTEYKYVYGTYERDYSEMVEGKKVERKESIVMNEDHTCVVTLEKTSNGDWTGTNIILEDGTIYEYTVEGDNLYLNNSNQVDEYTRKK